MKTLLVLRHAHAAGGSSYTSDDERPLSPQGQADAARVGRRLAQAEPPPVMILSSAALRAHQTAMAVQDALHEADLRLAPELYGADPAVWVHKLQELPRDLETVLIVGHNPDLELLVQGLTGRAAGFSPATLARLELPLDDWRDLKSNGSGHLVEIH